MVNTSHTRAFGGKSLSRSHTPFVVTAAVLTLALGWMPGAFAADVWAYCSHVGIFKNTGGCNYSNVGADYTIFEAAEADVGVLHAEVSTTANGAGVDPVADAGAAWSEQFTISADGLDGQYGTMYFEMYLEGSITVTGDPSANALLSLNTTTLTYPWSTPSFGASGIIQSGSGPYTASTGPAVFNQVSEGYINFQFGTPFTLAMSLEVAGGNKTFGGTGVSSVDNFFFDTSYWNGIVNVVDGDGNVVPYSLSTLSGIDFTQSFVPAVVPLPATLPLMLSGLAMVLGVIRRRS